MAGSITVSSITLDSDNNFSIKSNTGATLFFANTSGVDIANSIGATAITSDKILSIANTKISGNIISSQITSVANTQISGNIISSQIAPSVTLYGNPTVTSGNLTVGGSTSLGTASASGNTTMYQAPGSSFLIMNVNGTLAGARRNWAISPESQAAGALCFECGTSEGAVPSSPRLIIKQQGTVILSGGSTSADGTGITFPATINASSNANTLDDYEEGTWTPVVTSQSGSITSYTSAGSYTKIGNIVTLYCNVQVTSIGTASGQMFINGAPFNTLLSGQYAGVTRETTATGYIYFPMIAGSQISIQNSTNGGVTWATNYRYQSTNVYETT
jgi:hypothetical protein